MTTAAPATRAPAPPTADHATAHTLLNCLLREVCGPEHQTAVTGGRLLLRLPRTGVLLRVALRRTSLLGAHRFTGPVDERCGDEWRETDWLRLAGHIQEELTLRGGAPNEEFAEQVAASRAGTAAALAHRARQAPPAGDRYLASERSLALGHRFHPTPKARGADPRAWRAYAPEADTAFPLRYLAVREDLVAGECAAPGADALLDRLRPVPRGHRLLPVHPWQFELLGGHPVLRAALDRGDVTDLGTGGPPFAPTASVRTLHGGAACPAFLKFSLNVRITNCVRKNARYELTGAVALTRLLAPVLDDLAARFPGAAVLREPAYRSLALPGPGGHPEGALLEGFGVIVREGFDGLLPAGTTPLLAAAVADEYPLSDAHLPALLGPDADERAALEWWSAYLWLLLPPVLAAYLDHGVVLEPHLQNVVVCVDGDGMPRRVLLRDLEGTKLLAARHGTALAALDPRVAAALTYDPGRGWDRVVYCLLVNHTAEMLAVLADMYPHLEADLWARVGDVLREYAAAAGCPPPLRALLAGVPLPAKANLLTRWERRADRAAGYVRLPSPLAAGALS